MQGLSMGKHVTLKAGEGAGITDTGPGIVGEQRLDDARPVRHPARHPWLAASKTVPPYRSNRQAVRGLKPTAASIAVSAVVE